MKKRNWEVPWPGSLSTLLLPQQQQKHHQNNDNLHQQTTNRQSLSSLSYLFLLFILVLLVHIESHKTSASPSVEIYSSYANLKSNLRPNISKIHSVLRKRYNPNSRIPKSTPRSTTKLTTKSTTTADVEETTTEMYQNDTINMNNKSKKSRLPFAPTLFNFLLSDFLPSLTSAEGTTSTTPVPLSSVSLVTSSDNEVDENENTVTSTTSRHFESSNSIFNSYLNTAGGGNSRPGSSLLPTFITRDKYNDYDSTSPSSTTISLNYNSYTPSPTRFKPIYIHPMDVLQTNIHTSSTPSSVTSSSSTESDELLYKEPRNDDDDEHIHLYGRSNLDIEDQDHVKNDQKLSDGQGQSDTKAILVGEKKQDSDFDQNDQKVYDDNIAEESVQNDGSPFDHQQFSGGGLGGPFQQSTLWIDGYPPPYSFEHPETLQVGKLNFLRNKSKKGGHYHYLQHQQQEQQLSENGYGNPNANGVIGSGWNSNHQLSGPSSISSSSSGGLKSSRVKSKNKNRVKFQDPHQSFSHLSQHSWKDQQQNQQQQEQHQQQQNQQQQQEDTSPWLKEPQINSGSEVSSISYGKRPQYHNTWGPMETFEHFMANYKLLTWAVFFGGVALLIVTFGVWMYINNPPTEVVTARNFLNTHLWNDQQISKFLTNLGSSQWLHELGENILKSSRNLKTR